MNSVFILVAAAALGIEVGWEPLADGGHEYTIQIEPQLLDLLVEGKEIISEVPPQLNVRRYRVTVGTQKLERNDGQLPAEPAAPHRPNQAQRDPRENPHGPEHPQQYDARENPFTSQASEPAAADHAQAAPPTEPEGPVEEPAAEHPLAQRGKHKGDPPGMLPVISSGSKPIANQQVAHQESENVEANKPSLPPAGHGSTSHVAAEPSHPWIPLLIAMVLLCGSLSANAYLGWIAFDARRGHRDALAKFRTAGA